MLTLKHITEALYMEAGKMPIRYIIKIRRLMYWYHILAECKENSLVKNFYKTQKLLPTNNDWIKNLEEDKKEFGIDIDDANLIKIYKTKHAFKTYVKKQAKKKTEEYLRSLQNSHSKMENIKFETLECQTYLKSNIIGKEEAQILFKFRTRMYSVKENFKNYYKNSNLYCKFCRTSLCTQRHIFECKILKKMIPKINQNQNIKYEDIFGTEKEMSDIAKLLIIISEERKFLEDLLTPQK